MLGNNMQCEVRNQHIVANYMEQDPLEADSFTASRFAGISRTCNCTGLSLCFNRSQSRISVSTTHPQSIFTIPPEKIWVIRARDRRAVLLAEI